MHIQILRDTFDGLTVSGTELTQTLNALAITVTAGLAGDSDRFKESWVMVNGCEQKNQIALIGFYGELTVSYGFATGWKEFEFCRR